VSRYALLCGVTVEDAVLHCGYFLNWDGAEFHRTMSTRIRGVATSGLAQQFVAGDDVAGLAKWMGLTVKEVEDALRWELIPRRTRVRMVEKAIKRKPIK